MFDLADLKTLKAVNGPRQLLQLILLTAVKEKADRVSFEVVHGILEMKYQVEGQWHTMVPPPIHYRSLLVEEIRRFARLNRTGQRVRRGWLRSFIGPSNVRRRIDSASLTVRVKSSLMEMCARILPTRSGEQIILQLQPFGKVRQAASEVLDSFIGTGPEVHPTYFELDRCNLADIARLRALPPVTQLMAVAALRNIRDGADRLSFAYGAARRSVAQRVGGVWRDLMPLSESQFRRIDQAARALYGEPPRRVGSRLSSLSCLMARLVRRGEPTGEEYFEFTVGQSIGSLHVILSPFGNCITVLTWISRPEEAVSSAATALESISAETSKAFAFDETRELACSPATAPSTLRS